MIWLGDCPGTHGVPGAVATVATVAMGDGNFTTHLFSVVIFNGWWECGLLHHHFFQGLSSVAQFLGNFHRVFHIVYWSTVSSSKRLQLPLRFPSNPVSDFYWLNHPCVDVFSLNPRVWQQHIPFFWIELYQLLMKIRSVSFNLVDQIRKHRKDMPYFMVIYVISPYSMVISPDLKVNSPVVPGLTWFHLLPRPFAPFAVREDPRGPGDGAGHSQASPRPCRDFLKGNCTWGGCSLFENGAGMGFDGDLMG